MNWGSGAGRGWQSGAISHDGCSPVNARVWIDTGSSKAVKQVICAELHRELQLGACNSMKIEYTVTLPINRNASKLLDN
jgi:hypothetical protein